MQEKKQGLISPFATTSSKKFSIKFKNELLKSFIRITLSLICLIWWVFHTIPELLKIPILRTSKSFNSFSPRTTRVRNSLPAQVFPSVLTFRNLRRMFNFF